MKILKIFFVGVGLIIGLLLSASIGVAFDNFLQLKYTSNFENYWSEFRDIQNSTQSEVLYINVNDTLRMYKNDDIRMYNSDCITDTIVEVITTCNTYTLLTVHLL